MAKDKNKEYESIREMRKELERRTAQLSIGCSHTRKGGSELNVAHVKGSVYKCRECGTEFSIEPIPNDKFLAAVDLICSAINQTKSITSDPKGDKKIIEKLGRIEFDLKEFAKLYSESDLKEGKKKKKKNKEKGGTMGNYGTRSLFFNK